MKTIKIHDKTHAGLEDLFVGRDTFDGVINRLMVENKFLQDALKKLDKEDRERIIKQEKRKNENKI